MRFKERLLRGDVLIGTFLKTPSSVICEVLAQADFDVICIDAEHAPFDRGDIDACLLGFSRTETPVLVRPPAALPHHILNALDCGADGVLAPHIAGPDEAQRLADSARYGAGRGYAGSSRAAGYMAKSMPQHLADSAAKTCVIAQIEDKEALSALDDILRVDGIDAYFIGRADLTVSLGADSPKAPEVVEAVTEICRRGREKGLIIGMYTSDTAEIGRWRAQGASLFLLGSDHRFLLDGAAQFTRSVRAAL